MSSNAPKCSQLALIVILLQGFSLNICTCLKCDSFSICFYACLRPQYRRRSASIAASPPTVCCHWPNPPPPLLTCFTTSVNCSINDITAVGSLGNNCIGGSRRTPAGLYIYCAWSRTGFVPCSPPSYVKCHICQNCQIYFSEFVDRFVQIDKYKCPAGLFINCAWSRTGSVPCGPPILCEVP